MYVYIYIYMFSPQNSKTVQTVPRTIRDEAMARARPGGKMLNDEDLPKEHGQDSHGNHMEITWKSHGYNMP